MSGRDNLKLHCEYMGYYSKDSFASQMMAVKSPKAVIITPFLLIFLTQANVGDFTMADSAVFPLVLTAVSFGFAVLSICNVEKKIYCNCSEPG